MIDKQKPVQVAGLLIAFVLASLPLALAKSAAIIEVGKFSAAQPGDTLPDGWEPVYFDSVERTTTYKLVEDDEGGTVVLRAISDRAASGLKREIFIDPEEYPIVEWRWKVANVLKNGDITKKEGDDTPARLYVVFEYDSSRAGFLQRVQYETIRMFYGRYPPEGTINYVWESNKPVGSMVRSPYEEQVMMIVLESGAKNLNTWLSERRNVYEDYRKAFGKEPTRISGVALMTDTDNTQESATAYFGDIIFRQKP